jgi:hypothetical protein
MRIEGRFRSGVIGVAVLIASAVFAQPSAPKSSDAYADPLAARVFITDSGSWEISGQSAGAGGAFGSRTSGGARPQTAEIIKTFRERCPNVAINNIQTKADYIVLLDHEGGKGMLRHKNKVAVFLRGSGDSIVSKSTLSVGGSVQEACEAIQRHWTEHGQELRTEKAAAAPPPPALVSPIAASAPSDPERSPTAKLFIASTPDGADIEIDGSFVGNTPSDIEVKRGEHIVSVKKAGYAAWEKKLVVNGGSTVRLGSVLEKP